VVVVSDGTVLAERTFRPGDPKRCPRVISVAPGEQGLHDLFGRPATKAVLRFLRPFVGDVGEDEVTDG
jgi:hypothetical protein